MRLLAMRESSARWALLSQSEARNALETSLVKVSLEGEGTSDMRAATL